MRISAAGVLCHVPINCITQSYTCRDIFRFAIVARYSTIRARIQEISKFDINIEYVHFELGLNLTCPRRFTSIETPVQYILSFFNDIFIHLLLSELQTPSSHAPLMDIKTFGSRGDQSFYLRKTQCILSVRNTSHVFISVKP